RDLAITAKDAQGGLVAVSPGSATFTVASGSGSLQFTNGQATGVSAGSAMVTASLDGKVSPAAAVSVVIPLPAGYSVTDLGVLLSAPEDGHIAINNRGQAVLASINQV